MAEQQTDNEFTYGRATGEAAARQLGYELGCEHDRAHRKWRRLSIKETAEMSAGSLIPPALRAVFLAAYRQGCRDERQALALARRAQPGGRRLIGAPRPDEEKGGTTP